MSESDHIRQASEEIVLYLLKGEKIVGQKLWKKFVENVLKPNATILECYAASPSASQSVDKFDSDTRKHLGKFILSMVSSDAGQQVSVFLQLYFPFVNFINILRA
jgi:hypothetical protein